jgi:hypothetical protein
MSYIQLKISDLGQIKLFNMSLCIFFNIISVSLIHSNRAFCVTYLCSLNVLTEDMGGLSKMSRKFVVE